MSINATIARLLKPFSSNKYSQLFFGSLHKVALFGLFGDEWDFTRNGELKFIERVANRLTGNAIVFDAGANEGVYCEKLLSLFNKENVPVTVHGFEPALDTYKRYSGRFKNNDKVTCNNFGLSDKEESVNLYKSRESSGFATLYQENKFDFDSSETIQVTTIDKYCSFNNISIIHFLKMDVEGHEFSILKGAQQMINDGKIQIIQFEFGPGNISSRTYFKDFYDLLSVKYSIYRIVKNGIVPVLRYDYSLEVYGRVTNYAAISKVID